MIEQSGANIVDRMDVDPGLSVGETIDASGRRGVRSYRKSGERIGAVSWKWHLLLSHSEVPPGRLLLCYGGPVLRAARRGERGGRPGLTAAYRTLTTSAVRAVGGRSRRRFPGRRLPGSWGELR